MSEFYMTKRVTVGSTSPGTTVSGAVGGVHFLLQPDKRYRLPPDVKSYFETRGLIVPYDESLTLPEGNARLADIKHSL